MNSSRVILVFHLMRAAANATELFCMTHCVQTLSAFYIILTFHIKYQILYTPKLTNLS